MNTKCPNCKATLPANIGVCEWCGFVIDQEGNKSIENISGELEDIIKSMKSIEYPDFLSSFKRSAKISMSILGIAFFLFAYKLSAWFAVLAIISFIYALVSLFKRQINSMAELALLKGEFDEKVRNFHNLYGINNKFKDQIQQYQNEWKAIENAASKSRFYNWSSVSISAVVLAIAFYLPAPKTSTELINEMKEADVPSMTKIDKLLQESNFEIAKAELQHLKSAPNIIEARSKIQLKEIETALAGVEHKIEIGDISTARSELVKIIWQKNSTDYDLELYEEKYFKQFIALKSAVNEKLPEESRIRVESEFDF